MDKSSILELFLSRGAQIDKDALDALMNDDQILKKTINVDKDNLPTVITLEFIKSLQNQIDEILNVTTKQLSQILNQRYEFIKELLMEKSELPNIISINKISEKTKNFSLIGIVFAKNQFLTLEDKTGQINLTINDEEISKYIIKDDIIGVLCENNRGVVEAKQVVYPDIPFNRIYNKINSDKKIVFISDAHPDIPKAKYYDSLVNWLKNEKNLIIFFLGEAASNRNRQRILSEIHHPIYFYPEDVLRKTPVHITIENLKFIFTSGTFMEEYRTLWRNDTVTTAINLLKKRNLNPRLTHDSYNNNFLLKDVPDVIVVSGVDDISSTTYKGVLILTTKNFMNNPSYWLMDVQTRETFKIDLS